MWIGKSDADGKSSDSSPDNNSPQSADSSSPQGEADGKQNEGKMHDNPPQAQQQFGGQQSQQPGTPQQKSKATIMAISLTTVTTKRNHIVDSNMIKKYSPRDVFRAFDGVRKIKISGQWKLTRIIKNDQNLLKKLSLLPPNDEMEFDTKQSMEQSMAQEDE